MTRLVLRIGLYAVAIWVAVQLVEGLVFDGDALAYGLVALVMGAVNAFVRPIVKLLSLPIVFLTLGLFLLVINIAMFALVVGITDLTSTGLVATALGALVTTVVVSVGDMVLPGGD